VQRARVAARIAALKVGWAIVSLILLSSVLVEYTQPHPSRLTFLFVVAWVVASVWTYRSIRRARQET
jgi:hypothetical protein